MRRLLAVFLVAVLLFQTLGQELLVLQFALNRAAITQAYCVNKARPNLHCNGQCHLAKMLRRAADAESKAPATGFAKIKFEALLPLRLLLPTAAPAIGAARPRYAVPPVPALPAATLAGVFQPPIG